MGALDKYRTKYAPVSGAGIYETGSRLDKYRRQYNQTESVSSPSNGAGRGLDKYRQETPVQEQYVTEPASFTDDRPGTQAHIGVLPRYSQAPDEEGTQQQTDPYSKYYGMSSSEIQAELDRLTSEGAIYTTRAATDDEIAIEAARLDDEAENTRREYLDAYGMWQSGADGYDQGVVDEYDAAARRADAERDAFYSGLQATGGWEVTEITGNMYQDEIDWLTEYIEQQNQQTISAAEALRKKEEEIALEEARLSTDLNNAERNWNNIKHDPSSTDEDKHEAGQAYIDAQSAYDSFINKIKTENIGMREQLYINGDEQTRQELEGNINFFNQGGYGDMRRYRYMTAEEIKEYNDIYRNNPVEAYNYLLGLENDLNDRHGRDLASGDNDYLNVLLWAFSRGLGGEFREAAGRLSGTGVPESAADYALKYIIENYADENSNGLLGMRPKQLGLNIAHDIGAAVPYLALGKLGGDVLGAAASNADESLELYTDAVSEGYSKFNSVGYAATSFISNTVLDAVMSALIIEAPQNSVAKTLLDEVYRRIWLGEEIDEDLWKDILYNLGIDMLVP